MAIRLPIGNVLQAQRLGVGGGLETTGEEENVPVRMEVYTGWVTPSFGAGGSTAREEARTFLPLTNQQQIRSYQQDSLVDHTVTVSPATIAPEEDEATLFGVDGARVALEPQTFPGVGGTQFCLVLRVDLVGLNVTLHRFTYQVTVLIDENTETTVIDLNRVQRPA
jgi:hypothetical protein